MFRYIKAERAYRQGEMVFMDIDASKHLPIGIARNNIEKDHYGFVQIFGPLSMDSPKRKV